MLIKHPWCLSFTGFYVDYQSWITLWYCLYFDNEPETVEMMNEYAHKMGYEIDITDSRYHHEIYLSDFRKTATDKLKTVIRYPIKKML